MLACFTKAPPNFIDNRMSTHVKTRQEHHLKTILDRHPIPFLPCLVIVQLLFEIACCVQLLLCLVHGLKTGIEPAAGPCMPHAARVAAIKSAPDASTVFAALVALGLPELLSPSWSRLCAFLRSVSRFLTFARMHLLASFVAGRTPAGMGGMGGTRYRVEICARNVGSAVSSLNRPCWYKPIIPNLERNKYRSTTKTRDYNYSSYRVRSPRIFTL